MSDVGLIYGVGRREARVIADALLTPSGAAAHDSGPAWLATPWSYDSLIHCPRR